LSTKCLAYETANSFSKCISVSVKTLLTDPDSPDVQRLEKLIEAKGVRYENARLDNVAIIL